MPIFSTVGVLETHFQLTFNSFFLFLFFFLHRKTHFSSVRRVWKIGCKADTSFGGVVVYYYYFLVITEASAQTSTTEKQKLIFFFFSLAVTDDTHFGLHHYSKMACLYSIPPPQPHTSCTKSACTSNLQAYLAFHAPAPLQKYMYLWYLYPSVNCWN